MGKTWQSSPGKQRGLTSGDAPWLALSLVFHALPCGRVQTIKPTLFFSFKPQNPWDTNVIKLKKAGMSYWTSPRDQVQ